MPYQQLQFRRGTAAQWTAVNPVLADGELGLESDTTKFKVGNGSTAWNSLSYGPIAGVVANDSITLAQLATATKQSLTGKSIAMSIVFGG
jgi:hypothetical protein